LLRQRLEGTPGGLLTRPELVTLRLVGARVALDGSAAVRASVIVEDGRILDLTFDCLSPSSPSPSVQDRETVEVDLTGYLLLPGIVNPHDHLEFNLFPRLGKGPYQNFEEWVEEIYHPEDAPVRDHLAVPKAVRLWWGGIKNLLCGVTTVCHHNPFERDVFTDDFPVRVVRRYGWAHSLHFGGNILEAFRGTPPGAPFVLHLAEGVDPSRRDEIFELDRLGALDRRTVIVHGVGLDAAGHRLLRQRGAGLIWCPSSNLFLLRQTLNPEGLKRIGRVALGNDSALTAEGDFLDEIRAALRTTGMCSEDLWHLVTAGAADMLRLIHGEGGIRSGSVADLVALPDASLSPAQTLARARFSDVELVLLGGKPRLFSPRMSQRWPDDWRQGLEPLVVEGTERWVKAPVAWLFRETEKALGRNFELARKKVERGAP